MLFHLSDGDAMSHNAPGPVSAALEEEELDHYIRIEQMMSLLKAKAYNRLEPPTA